nr:hypothetical protein BaRGS_028805 [Batillaria attramentaria]
MNLIPKPPKGDFVKFMVKDRQGLESNILRFLARMDTQHPIDKDRRFIISYFRSDDTILVFEPPVRNSGVIGGKFLERGRIKKPDQMRYCPQLSEYYMAPDLYVGAHLNVNKHKFIVIDADEYAFHYMEQHPEEFPKSNPKLIMEKIRAKLNQKREEARTFFTSQKDFGGANYGQLHNLLQKVDPSLTDQEVITLARYFALMRPKCIDSLKLLSIAQVELRKRNFDGFNVLLDRLTQEDKTKSGYIAKQAVRNALLSNHVPLTVDVIDGVIDV